MTQAYQILYIPIQNVGYPLNRWEICSSFKTACKWVNYHRSSHTREIVFAIEPITVKEAPLEKTVPEECPSCKMWNLALKKEASIDYEVKCRKCGHEMIVWA